MAFLFVSLHGLYAAAYVFVHTERAVEHHVRPFSYRLGIENSEWLYRRLTDYDDEAGARRAALFMIVFSMFTLVCTVVGAVVLLAT